VTADPIKELRKHASDAGLTVRQCSPDHWQIEGALLVNYYPLSAKKTAYVAGTTAGRKSVSPKEAVAMAMMPPPVTKPSKRKSMTKIKLRMLEKNRRCAWCNCELTAETATVDHVIPLSRGGLDNANNRVLACQPCNQKRGNAMPEICKGEDK
jgi:hypothetical protein